MSVVMSEGSSRSTQPSLWQWPNLLALDAAWIAVVWQQWMGHTSHAAAWVLGLSVWLIYTADRLLDTRKLPEEKILTLRHQMSRRWQKKLLPIGMIILLLNLCIALNGLSWRQFASGAVLLVLCLGYTLAVHRKHNVPKELLVSAIFTAGVVIFQIESIAPFHLLIGSISIFLLVFANCTLIATREATLDLQMGYSSLARQYPSAATWARIGLIFTLITGVLLFSYSDSLHSYILLSFCAAGILLLDTYSTQIPPELFRVLADSILLLPALTLIP